MTGLGSRQSLGQLGEDTVELLSGEPNLVCHGLVTLGEGVKLLLMLAQECTLMG